MTLLGKTTGSSIPGLFGTLLFVFLPLADLNWHLFTVLNCSYAYNGFRSSVHPPSEEWGPEGDLEDFLNYIQMDILSYKTFTLGVKLFINNSHPFLPQVHPQWSLLFQTQKCCNRMFRVVGTPAALLPLPRGGGVVASFGHKCLFPPLLSDPQLSVFHCCFCGQP